MLALTWKDRVKLRLPALLENHEAMSAFETLVSAGADPDQMMNYITEWNADEQRRWSPARRLTRGDYELLLHRMFDVIDGLNRMYAEMTEYWRRRFRNPVSDLLQDELGVVMAAAFAMNRGTGDPSEALTMLQQHVLRRTSRPNHALIAAVLSACHVRGLRVEIKSLENRSARGALRKERPIPNEIAARLVMEGRVVVPRKLKPAKRRLPPRRKSR
jgi:hypothetical protein